MGTKVEKSQKQKEQLRGYTKDAAIWAETEEEVWGEYKKQLDEELKDYKPSQQFIDNILIDKSKKK